MRLRQVWAQPASALPRRSGEQLCALATNSDCTVSDLDLAVDPRQASTLATMWLEYWLRFERPLDAQGEALTAYRTNGLYGHAPPHADAGAPP